MEITIKIDDRMRDIAIWAAAFVLILAYGYAVTGMGPVWLETIAKLIPYLALAAAVIWWILRGYGWIMDSVGV